MRLINNKSDKSLSAREDAAKPLKQTKYAGERSFMDTGTICELMIALFYLIKIIFH